MANDGVNIFTWLIDSIKHLDYNFDILLTECLMIYTKTNGFLTFEQLKHFEFDKYDKIVDIIKKVEIK